MREWYLHYNGFLRYAAPWKFAAFILLLTECVALAASMLWAKIDPFGTIYKYVLLYFFLKINSYGGANTKFNDCLYFYIINIFQGSKKNALYSE